MKHLIFISCLLLSTLVTAPLFSGPTIIRDSRITDTGHTPVLGRGYSIGTNTFQSTCLEDIVMTTPSYDLLYNFRSLEEASETTQTRQTATSQTSSSTKSRDLSWSSSSIGGFFGSSRSKSSTRIKSSVSRMYSKSGKSRTTEKGKETSHIIEVTVNLVTYYASVDETQSTLGKSAARLLINKDIPGFFSSCGPYYVRSIGREATLLSFFEYTTTTTERDSEFETNIESQIKGFRSVALSRSSSSGWGLSKSSSTASSRDDYASTSSQKNIEQFNSKAEERNLTITTYAFGLGKRRDAEIISYDIESFKNAIKEAFISMQNAKTGKVVNMEVVPWVENTQFQQLIKLEQSEPEYEDVLDATGQPALDDEGNPMKRLKPPMMLYEKKMLLNENAEFIIEIDRVDRNIMNMFYKAKLCRRNIDVNWKSKGKLREEYEGALLQNNRFRNKTIAIDVLDEAVSQKNVDAIYQTHKTFMYGTGKKNGGGASVCIAGILREGIFKMSYREIEACQPIIQNMGEIQNDVIENYCMPELAN